MKVAGTLRVLQPIRNRHTESCLLLLGHQLFDQFGQQGRVVLASEMLDPLRGQAKLFEGADDVFPLPLAGLALARYSSVTSSLSRCSEIASRFS